MGLGLLGVPVAAPAGGATHSAGADSPRSNAAHAAHTADTADVPAGVTAGIAVFDRRTGEFTERREADRRFRSASVVKLLLVLDVLWDRAPSALPAEERARLEAMLRHSDDQAASHYWAQRGGSRIIERMVPRLGLTGTVPPPSTHPGYWGYTALTAADTVRIYRHLLEEAPAAVRDFVLGHLHRATRCAGDGFDQYFGIASAFDKPWALKQGWSGFTSGGCTAGASPARTRGPHPGRDGRAAPETRSEPDAGHRPEGRPSDPPVVDLVSEALHTTGTVGPDDRTIVAVLTLHPDGTPYGTAYSRLTRLAGSLDVPGAERPAGTWFGTWGSGVRVRAAATTGSDVVTTLPAGVEVLVACQQRGQRVEVPPYSNDWWAYLPQYGGYLTNIYVDTPGNTLPDVPECRQAR